MPTSWTCNPQEVRCHFWCWIQTTVHERTNLPVKVHFLSTEQSCKWNYQQWFPRRTKDCRRCPLSRRCMVCVSVVRPQQVSPQCSRTILHTAMSLKVLSTFKEIRDIFSGGKEGLLPGVWQLLQTAIVLSGERDRLTSRPHPCASLGRMDNPRNLT